MIMIEYIKTLFIILFYLLVGFFVIVGIPVVIWSFIETFFLKK